MITDRLKRWSKKPWSRDVEARPGYKATWYRRRTGTEISLMDNGEWRCEYDSDDAGTYDQTGTSPENAVRNLITEIAAMRNSVRAEIELYEKGFPVKNGKIPEFLPEKNGWTVQKSFAEDEIAWGNEKFPSLELYQKETDGQVYWSALWEHEDTGCISLGRGWIDRQERGSENPNCLIQNLILALKQLYLIYWTDVKDLEGIAEKIHNGELKFEEESS